MFDTVDIRKVDIGRNWGWVLAAGIGYVILGFAAINWPVSSTVGLTFALGLILILTGIVQGVHAFEARKEGGVAWHVFLMVVALAAGVVMLRHPTAGMVGIAITMTFYFFVGAFAKGAFALSLRPMRRWGWVMASAVASFILGAYMLLTFPISALWIPGLMLGIDLVFQGASLIGASLEMKQVHRGFEQRRTPSLA